MRAGSRDTGTANCALSHCLPMRLSPRRKNTFLCCAPRISFRRCVCRVSWRPVQKGWRALVRMGGLCLERRAEQNRYYWSAVLQHIAEHAEVGGRRYDKDVWHEYFARRFGLCDEVTLPDG